MSDDKQQPTAADIAREMRAQEAAEKKAKEAEAAKKSGQGCMIVVAIIVVVGVIVWFSSSNNSGGGSTTSEVITLPGGREVSATLANNLCRDPIRERLVSPSSAEFPGVFSSDYSLPTKVGNTWRNTIRVDAQNAFGAMVRSNWFCEVNGDTGMITVREQ